MSARLRPAVASLAIAGALLTCGSAPSSPGWPQIGQNSAHNSYVADSKISTATATQFGVKWMANLYNADLGSPVLAFNSVLGKNVVYVGNQRADFFAIDAATGEILWSTNLGVDDKIEDSPTVAPDGSVWVGTSFNPTLYKLDGATGNVDCSVKAALPINGSPMYAVPAGGVPTVYWDTIDDNATQGPMIATRESDCTQVFVFSSYLTHAGSWTTPAFGTTANGEPIALIGTADTDSTEYAVDANTGALVWDFPILNPPPKIYDVGDAADVSAPGVNGFAGGVAYVGTKYGVEYALDLTTGKPLWHFNMSQHVSLAAAALDGTALVFGYGGGVYSLNAVTGSQNWSYPTAAEVDSSPIIIGSPGSEVVSFGDLTGAFQLVALSGGTSLYKYQTGAYITASPAEKDGIIFVSSADGFLYAFAAGGGNGQPPSTQITSPASQSQIPNPDGDLVVTGSSSDAKGVRAVEVAVLAGGTSGEWYDAEAGTYNKGPIRNAATVANPGAKTSTWSFAFPAPEGGGNFTVYANTVNRSHIVDRGTNDSFTILPLKGEPNLIVSPAFDPPVSTFTAHSAGFTPGEQVNFTFLGATAATVTAGPQGYVQTNIRVPMGAPFGRTTLTATGALSGKTTSAVIDVTNNWVEFGHDSLRTSEELHDPVIQASLGVDGTSILSQSWYYMAGSPVNTSPAVVDGVVYFGSDNGVLSAVIANTGAPAWSYATPSKSPIRSSPAVDSAGTVIFGANDGTLYLVNSSGTLLQSVSLGGDLDSPAIGANQIYIGSGSGTLYDVADPSGAVQWTASPGAAIHSNPAFDPVSNLVIIGSDNGDVTAYNATTGAQLWQATTGGAVTAQPLIDKGVVYVGSADGNFYALNEATGAANWKFTANGPILTGASLYQPGAIAFGTKTGTEYNLSLSGTMNNSISAFAKSAIIGLGDVFDNTLVETSAGAVSMIRFDNGGPSIMWSFKTGSTLRTAPVIVDGTVYIGAADGGLYAFTPQGANPQSKTKPPTISITDSNDWICTTP